MSDRIQVLLTGLMLVIICAWAYYFQFEYTALLDTFDFAPDRVWQEPWRLLTAHFLHLTQLHWLLNGLAFAMLTLLFANYFTVRTFLNALMIITIGSGVVLTAFGFNQHFVGLSIVNHGLLTMGLLLELQSAETPAQRKPRRQNRR